MSRLRPAALLLALACASSASAAETPAADVSPAMQAALDAAEALHLKREYRQALAAYDRLIADHPGWLRPRYLRWILFVDMNDLPRLETELGFAPGLSFYAMQDAAMARLPAGIAGGRQSPRPWLHEVACRYLEATVDTAAAGEARIAAIKRVLAARDLPAALRAKLEDALPELDRAEAAHLAHHYASALTRYDAFIAKDPALLRPHYLRWILLVDMGAFSILHRDLGLDAEIPFEESLENAMAHLPEVLRQGKENPRPWLHQVVLRYYAAKPTQVANRGDTALAIRTARRALAAPGLPLPLDRELRANLVVYLSDAGRFAETVEAADDLEKRHGEPDIRLLTRKAAALEALGRRPEASALYRRIETRLTGSGAPFADFLPHLRGEYECRRDAGQIAEARAILARIRDNTPPPQPARKGCAPDWSGDYAWIELQEVRLLLQEKRLDEAEARIVELERNFAGAAEVVFLRGTLEHLRGNPRRALAFFRRLEAEEMPPNPRTVACRLAAQHDAGDPAEKARVREEFARWRKTAPERPEWVALARRLGEEGHGAARRGRGAADKGDDRKDAGRRDGAPAWRPGEVMAMCYHDIPDQVPRGDEYGVDVETFVSHLELLSARGFRFVRLRDIAAAKAGQAPLPKKSALLTFDDGCLSHHDNLLPLLELYRAPAVLGICTSQIGKTADPDRRPQLMTEAQLQETARSPWVEIAAHSHDLHRALPMNSFGNTAPAALARHFEGGAYETDAAHATRLAADIRENLRRLRELTGQEPLGLAWPYGAHNAETDGVALQEGVKILMDLGDGTYRPEDFPHIPRYLVFHTTRQADLSDDIAAHAHRAPPIRAAYLPLDGLVAGDAKTTAANLDRAVAELSRRHPSHVVLDVSSETLGPCYPEGYPEAQARPHPDWVSHIARSLEVHDMAVILRVAARDRRRLQEILKLPAADNVFLDFPASAKEVELAQSMRTEGRVLARLGGPANADLFVHREGRREATLPHPLPDNLVFWCETEPALRQAAAAGAEHWISPAETRFNATRSFMTRPPADPHWLMWP